MAAPIQRLAKMSSKIFGMLTPDKITKDHLTPLIHSINEITADDLNFNAGEIEERDAAALGEIAPVTYMHLLQDHTFTMAVFVVKSGGALPLHDHPKMHGLLKVIYGTIKIISYSEVASETSPDSTLSLTPTRTRSGAAKRVKTVRRHEDLYLSEKDGCCVLSPHTSNFHEIHSETKLAAFLDILAPPYKSDNDCHYYQEVGAETTGDTRWLKEIPQPYTYWCDTIKYRGPPLT